MPSVKKPDLRATPELEDFGHKYTDEGQGKIGRKLLNNYFKSVEELVITSGVADGKSAKAIEIGCGEGYSTQRLRGFLPQSIDLSASEYVVALVPKAQELNPEVKIIQESAYETNHKDGSFDLVFLLEVLEHLDYPDLALKEIARILKPDGYLVLGVPREPLWCGLNMARGKYISRTPGHLNHWPSYALKRLIKHNFGPIVASRQPLPWTQVLAQKS